MLPHKQPAEPLFRSEPVSRVGSSVRLSQLASVSSRPGTPLTYVVSSLNPVKNTPVDSRGSVEDTNNGTDFNNLPIVKQINNFELKLAELSTKISTFKEDGIDEIVASLIQIDEDLKRKALDLKKHNELGREIEELEQVGSKFDSKFKFILKELISFRAELLKLPKKPQEELTKKNDFSTDDVLKYAMKLAKFTKAPPTIAQPYQIHPNNYVWPAEDALRRGMLAQCSLTPDEIVNAELNSGEVKEQVATPVVEKVPSDKPQERPQPKRRTSFGDYGSSETKETQNDEDLDLDLFDPDEFSD